MAEAANQAAVVNYNVIEKERASEIQKTITERLNEVRDTGGSETLRHFILNQVIAANYATALRELENYISDRTAFPNFQVKALRYKEHCFNLIKAIETKRNFHGLGSLPLATQQEIYEKILEHFEELKQLLMQIERLEKEAKLDDIRSTVWFLRALTYSVIGLFGFGVFLDFAHGMSYSLLTLLEAYADDLAAFIVKFLG